MKCLLIILCLIGVSFSSGCVQRIESPKSSPSISSASQQLSDCVGMRVQVQFRRDILGASRDLPIGPETSSLNGAETSLYGELTSFSDESVVITTDGDPQWIPREVILYIRVSP